MNRALPPDGNRSADHRRAIERMLTSAVAVRIAAASNWHWIQFAPRGVSHARNSGGRQAAETMQQGSDGIANETQDAERVGLLKTVSGRLKKLELRILSRPMVNLEKVCAATLQRLSAADQQLMRYIFDHRDQQNEEPYRAARARLEVALRDAGGVLGAPVVLTARDLRL